MASKEAFAKMMAELSDSDSDSDDGNYSKWKSKANTSMTTSRYIQEPSSPRPMGLGGTKTSSQQDKISTEYDDDNNDDIANFGTAASVRQSTIMTSSSYENVAATVGISSDSSTDVKDSSKKWLLRPCRNGDAPLLCYVVRDRSVASYFYPVYRMYLGDNATTTARFMMADEVPDDDRGSDSVIGKLRGNTLGSSYTITDSGLAPDKSVLPSMVRKELGYLKFQFNVGGPAKIEGYIPEVAPNGIPYELKDSIETCVADGKLDRLLRIDNKEAAWDANFKGHVLNFNGRVTESSVKNFQIVVSNDKYHRGADAKSGSTSTGTFDNMIMQFGKVGKDKFNLDVKYPLSPYQAFCIAIACMDGKIADKKVYETVSRMLTSVSGSGNAMNSKSMKK